MKVSTRLPLCRSMLICFGLVQSLSASAAGLRHLPRDAAGQTPTVQVATPGAHALSPEERNALIGELADAPEFSIKVNQPNRSNEGPCPVSISETRVQAVHRNAVRRTYVYLPVCDHGCDELVTRPELVSCARLIAVIQLVRQIGGIVCVKRADRAVFCRPHNPVTCAVR